MSPDAFAAWLVKLMPEKLAFVVVAGDLWHVHLVWRDRSQSAVVFEVENPSGTSLRKMVSLIRRVKQLTGAVKKT